MLFAVFAGGLVIASVLATKIITVFGLFVPAGVLAYSLTFIATDVISETWGKRLAGLVVFGGFVSLVVVSLLVQVALVWPQAPFWKNDAAFTSVLGSTVRVIIASLAAYLVSQYHDVWMFHLLKRAFGGRYLWLRNNISTMISQFIDSFLFIAIAFYGVMPIWPLILGQWVIKLAIAVLDTPVVYLLVWLFKRERK
ncbi:MAG: queuosine precursor transporter [bacterium]|nr:queuosine precursor transporter [bacterium]